MRPLTLFLSLAVGILVASPLQAIPVHQWSQSFGDAHDQDNMWVAVDDSGNILVTGWFVGTMDFGGGPLTSAGNYDIFVAKFDTNGNHLWSKSFGDGDSQAGGSIASDGSGNVVVVGGFVGTVDFGGGPLTEVGLSDMFVAKFDANGGHLWSRSFGDDDRQGASSVAVDGSGNIVVTGSLYGTVDFGGGPLTSVGGADIVVTKFDGGGNHLWSRGFGNVNDDIVDDAAVDGSDNIIVTGLFVGAVDFGGGPLTSAGEDIFVVKLDSAGGHLWSQNFGDDCFQVGVAVAADGSGNIALTGQFDCTVDFGGGPLTSAGGEDLFVAKFDATGSHLWSHSYGNAEWTVGQAISIDGAGSVVISGLNIDTVDLGGGALTGLGGADVFVAKYDADGNHVWSRLFGDDGDLQYGCSIATDAWNSIIVTGAFYSGADFGGGPLTSAGLRDVFLAKFSETPLPVLITNFNATTRGGAVELHWAVWSDEALASFTLYRGDDAHPQAIVIAEGPFDATTRSYVDASVEPEKTFHYELVIHTRGGDDIRSQVATVTIPRLEATLGQNFPNPFNPSTTIEYTLSDRSRVAVVIFDAAGALAARLDEGEREAGTHRVEWDGRDAFGRRVGSGVYFYQFEGAARTGGRKMVLLK